MYQRGLAIISFIPVIFLLSGAIIGGSFYIKDKGSILHRSASTIPSVDKPQTQTTERPTRIYTNTQMGFSINYPSGNLAYESKEETYFVVYINREETFWEVYNELPDKERREKTLKSFEDTLSTLKFLD